MTDETKLLTVRELSDYLGISDETLRKYRMKKIGPKYLKLGRVVRYKLDDVLEWIDAQTKVHTEQQD